MKTPIQEQEALFSEFAEKFTHQRYRLGIVCSDISSRKTEIAQAVAKALHGNYVSLASELLPGLVQRKFSPTLGAFGPDDLIKYIISCANKSEVKLLIVDQIEPLISTFGRSQAVNYFRMLCNVEPLKPVILITYLKRQVDEGSFPKDRIINL
jgi:hypothetical protein